MEKKQIRKVLLRVWRLRVIFCRYQVVGVEVIERFPNFPVDYVGTIQYIRVKIVDITDKKLKLKTETITEKMNSKNTFFTKIYYFITSRSQSAGTRSKEKEKKYEEGEKNRKRKDIRLLF